MCALCAAQITQQTCEGQCFNKDKNFVSAKFDDNGRSILVTLSTRADMLNAPCALVLDTSSDTGYRLGGSRCIVSEGVRFVC